MPTLYQSTYKKLLPYVKQFLRAFERFGAQGQITRFQYEIKNTLLREIHT